MLVLSRVYQRRWRYASQRDYEAVVGRSHDRAADGGAVAILRPVHRTRTATPPAHDRVAIVLPNSVIVLFALLSLVFLVGVRALARSVYERRPLAALRGAARTSAPC